MKTAIFFAMSVTTSVLMSVNAFASETVGSVIVRDGNSVRDAKIVVDSQFDNGAVTSITKPYIYMGLFSRRIAIQAHDGSGDALCKWMNPSRPYAFVGQVGVANDALLSILNSKHTAVLSIENGELVADLNPVGSGSWRYVHQDMGCSSVRVESEGQ